ncbi:MAG: sigma-70 family RNA polymerase sigma factor [Hyphomonas sp.]
MDCVEPSDAARQATLAAQTSGGQALLSELDRDYRHPLHAYFRHHGCSPSAAEDLTQEVFLRIIDYQRANEIRNTRAFLFRVAANLLRDRARSAKRWNLSSLEDAGPIELSHRQLIECITPERMLEGRQDIQVLTEALEELDSRSQRIFLMNRIERLRHKDIAAALGLSVSLVEKTMRGTQDYLEARFRRQQIRKRAAGGAR